MAQMVTPKPPPEVLAAVEVHGVKVGECRYGGFAELYILGDEKSKSRASALARERWFQANRNKCK